ncbi:MAG: hypothetical protein L6Q92_01835 [Phycisphaerae bacterium]|nr:hypothetical protein [Phycisphaerae bacterium]
MIVTAAVERAVACSVCFGDPSSPMVQGVGMGILVLLGFIGTVLIGIVSVSGYWIVRARRMSARLNCGARSDAPGARGAESAPRSDDTGQRVE